MHSILLGAQVLTEINLGEENLVFLHRTKKHFTIQAAVRRADLWLRLQFQMWHFLIFNWSEYKLPFSLSPVLLIGRSIKMATTSDS